MSQTKPVVMDLSIIPDVAIKRIYQDFRVCLPAGALTYDRDASRTTAVPKVQFQTYAGELVTDPAVPSVPVLHYAGGGYGAWFDLRDGDPLLMVAADGPVGGYYATGNPTVPGAATGSHTWGCALALPGGRVSNPQQPTAPPNAPGEFLVGAADGSAAITFRGSGLTTAAELGSTVLAVSAPTASLLLGSATASFPPALADLVQANLAALNAAIQGIPTTGNPIADSAVAAIKTAMGTWASTLQSMADAKSRMDGPV